MARYKGKHFAQQGKHFKQEEARRKRTSAYIATCCLLAALAVSPTVASATEADGVVDEGTAGTGAVVETVVETKAESTGVDAGSAAGVTGGAAVDEDNGDVTTGKPADSAVVPEEGAANKPVTDNSGAGVESGKTEGADTESGAESGGGEVEGDKTETGDDSEADKPATGETDGDKAEGSETDKSETGEAGDKTDKPAADDTKADDKVESDKTDATTTPANKAESPAAPAKKDEVSVPAGTEKVDIANGDYVIGSGTSDKQVLDTSAAGRNNGTNIQTYESNMSGSQKWYISKNKDGFYTVALSENHNKVLDVACAGTANGTNVWLFDRNGTKSQLWTIVRNKQTGLFSFVSALYKDLVLDLFAAGSTNCTNVDVFQWNGTKAQQFYLLSTNPSQNSTASNYVEKSNVDKKSGVYEITFAGRPGSSLDIAAGSFDNGANVQAYTKNGSAAQRFYLERDADGFYTITVIGTGKVLDVSCGNIVPSTNVWQWDRNNTDAQKWALRENADGTFSFINKATGLVLDVTAGNYGNGSNVQGYRDNGSKAQRFKLVESEFITDGIYAIRNANDLNKVLDVMGNSASAGAVVHLWTNNNSNAQRFEVKSLGNGEYLIRTASSGGYLGINTTSGNPVLVQTGNKQTDMNTWVAVWKNGYFSLMNKALKKNNMVIDLEAASTADGTRVQLFKANGSGAQHFFFTAEWLVANGNYEIQSVLGTTLDVPSGSKDKGVQIQTWAKNGNMAQKFAIEYVRTEGGYAVYRIKSVASDLYLDVAAGSKADGACVQQWEWNGSAAQLWVAFIQDDGTVGFRNLGSGKALDVSAANKNNGAQIVQFKDNGTVAQRWKLIETIIYRGWTNQNGVWYWYDDNGNATAMSNQAHSLWERIKNYSSQTQYLIAVDVDNPRTVVYQGSAGNWVPIFDWACTTGSPKYNDGYGTWRNDNFYIGYNPEPSYGVHVWHDPASMMHYFTNFFLDQGFHSLIDGVPADQQLGYRISHGCIRLEYENALWIYNAPLGTRVVTV